MQKEKASLSQARLGAGRPPAFRIPQVPVEWLDASAWRLPSGKALAEFAFQAGFLAPVLLKAGTAAWGPGSVRRGGRVAQARGVR